MTKKININKYIATQKKDQLLKKLNDWIVACIAMFRMSSLAGVTQKKIQKIIHVNATNKIPIKETVSPLAIATPWC